MPNPRYAKFKGTPPPAGQRGGRLPEIVEKTAAWPSVPGPTQRKARNNGVQKIKNTMRSEGV